MAVELNAIGIRENPKIKGIEINGSILKITQLVDDTTCFVTDIPSVNIYNPVSLNTRAIYNVLLDKKKRSPSCIEKWSENYPGSHTAQQKLWSNIFIQPFSITRETKLQTFRYKLIHLLITCQKKVFDMKLVDNAICLYCQETDHITHFVLFCPKEKQFWNTFFTW